MNFVRRSSWLIPLFLCVSWLCLIPARAAVVVSIGQNFSGISYGSYNTNSGALPPDSDGEIGPNHYVEFINGMFAVFDKASGSLVELKTDVDFWASAGVGVSAEYEVTDPRVIYDSSSQRWFASQVDADVFAQILDNVLSTNDFLLAVSATSDPTGKWKGISFPSDPTALYFADFPTLGVDNQGVYLAADMFDASGDPTTATDAGCSLVSFPKTNLLASPPVFSNRTLFGNMSFSERGQIFQPPTCSDGSAAGKVLAAGDIGNDSNFHSNVVTFPVQNAAGPGPATLGPSTFIAVPPYMVPNNAAMGVPLFTALQPDGTSTLQANDARFCAKAYTVAGVIYGVHNSELNGHIAIRWYRIRASDAQLLESGTIADTNQDLFYPSIAVNPAGIVVIGYNGSGLSTYVSCYAIAGQTVGGLTTFGSPILLQTGVTSYHGDDEDPTGMFGNPTSRWGDYSTTSVDPSDPSRFWTIQMYPSDVDVWTTQITELVTTVPAQLAIARSGTNVTISWSSLLAGFQLQATPSLVSPVAWTNVTQTLTTNGGLASVTLPIGPGQRLFRLQKP